jgi:hypothetical protein
VSLPYSGLKTKSRNKQHETGLLFSPEDGGDMSSETSIGFRSTRHYILERNINHMIGIDPIRRREDHMKLEVQCTLANPT